MDLSNYKERQKFIKKLIFWSVLIGGAIALFFIPTGVNGIAQAPVNLCETGIGGCVEGTESIGSGREGISDAILSVVYFLIYLSVAISVLILVVGGLKAITSNGNEDQYKNAMSTVKNAVIGLVISIVSLTVVTLIATLVGGLNLTGLFD